MPGSVIKDLNEIRGMSPEEQHFRDLNDEHSKNAEELKSKAEEMNPEDPEYDSIQSAIKVEESRAEMASDEANRIAEENTSEVEVTKDPPSISKNGIDI